MPVGRTIVRAALAVLVRAGLALLTFVLIVDLAQPAISPARTRLDRTPPR
ncbi:MAG TPA: hypothetical protein VFM93_01915 [Candidatus Limnocylindria bacterium]|nr:hypothetical protein [Candidatus Limnocylindria bacterium]